MTAWQGWRALLRGLAGAGSIWAPVQDPTASRAEAVEDGPPAFERHTVRLRRSLAGGPPAGHPECWNPFLDVSPAERALWEQIDPALRKSEWWNETLPRSTH